MLDTYASLWNRVKLRCPLASPQLCQQWVVDSFREIQERRLWSWQVKYSQFLIPAVYNTGTVAVVRGLDTVTGTTTVWTGDMVGRQFRIGITGPIYTIIEVTSATSLRLDQVWGGATNATANYQIYLCYLTPPQDFGSFLSVVDVQNNWQLHLNIHQEEIDMFDPQRANQGQAYMLASRDFTANRVGSVKQPLQVEGTGPVPLSAGAFTGISDSIFTVEITTGGTVGTAEFKWKLNSGTYTTGVVTASTPLSLSQGVLISFPPDTYIVGDVFVIRTYASQAPGLPRYELWPHVLSEYVYPFCYLSKLPDLSDTGAVLPRYIRGDVVLELALAKCSQWPGPDEAHPNPYYRLELSDRHLRQFEAMNQKMERQDDEIYESTVYYEYRNYPIAPIPFLDSRWLQNHAF